MKSGLVIPTNGAEVRGKKAGILSIIRLASKKGREMRGDLRKSKKTSRVGPLETL